MERYSNGSAHGLSRDEKRMDRTGSDPSIKGDPSSKAPRGSLSSSMQRLRAMRHQAHLDTQPHGQNDLKVKSRESVPAIPTSPPPISSSASFTSYSEYEHSRSREPPLVAKKPNMSQSISNQLSSSTGAVSARTDPPRSSEVKAEPARRPQFSGARAKPSGRNKEVEGYVGFANLPNQVYRRSVKNGFDFTLMVVGESGLGKSTLINSLFLTDIYSTDYPGPSHRQKKTLKIDTTRVLLKEGGVQLRLTVVDTPGFGDAVDNSNCWQPVLEYIERRYEEHLASESKVNRMPLPPDGRVHCCLYFIAPTGHGLKPLDIEFMKKLHEKVNIVPIIAKSDTMTQDEIRDFKRTITNEIAQHKIKVYEFPDESSEEGDERSLRERVPFAVVGSNYVLEVGGHRVRGRQYPWGIVEVDNLTHNDFVALRDMVVRTHMQDLVDVTHNVHYENFRYRKLAPSDGQERRNSVMAKNPLTQIEEERAAHDQKLKKMESEMEQVFETKVREKMQKLRDSEADLDKKTEQMNRSLENSRRELEERRLQFERERAALTDDNRSGAGNRGTLDSRDGDKKKEKHKHKSIFS